MYVDHTYCQCHAMLHIIHLHVQYTAMCLVSVIYRKAKLATCQNPTSRANIFLMYKIARNI